MVAEIKNGMTKIIAEKNKTLPHTHVIGSEEGQVNWKDIEDAPLIYDGSELTEADLERLLRNYRTGQINGGLGWLSNSPAFLNRAEFLVYLNHNRIRIRNQTTVLGTIPEGFRPMNPVIAVWAAQGGSGNDDGFNGLVFINPNGTTSFTGVGGLGTSPSWPGGNCIVSFSAMWICSEPMPQIQPLLVTNNISIDSINLRTI